MIKETVTHTEAARDLVQHYLPQPIAEQVKLSALEIIKDSFIDENLQEIFTDNLYRVKLNGEESKSNYIKGEQK